MDRFMDRYGGGFGGFGSGNRYGMFGEGTGFGSNAEQDLIREILSGRSSGYNR